MDLTEATQSMYRLIEHTLNVMEAQPRPLDLVALGIRAPKPEPAPAPPPQSTAALWQDPQNLRPLADLLCIWRLCGRAACHRSRRCRGAPRECLEACAPLIPEAARLWPAELMKKKELGYTFEEAINALPYENQAVFAAWRAACRGKLPAWAGKAQ